ncbi:MAG: aminoglycoside phosphotransferase family protein [Candidatus Nanohaloarchaea archaeon]
MEESRLQSEIEEVLGKEFDWREIEKGLNTIYEISSDLERLILKVHTNEKMEIERFNAEPEIYELIDQHTEVPSPEIIYSDFSEDELPAFYIMEKIEGENAAEVIEVLPAEKAEKLFYQYGKYLGELHESTSFEEHGLIFKNGKLGTEKGFNYWEDSFRDLIKENIEFVKCAWDRPPEFSIEIKNLVKYLPNAEPVILHHDNRLENLILQDDKIEGFLDWSFTRAGHSEYDLVLAEYLLIDWDLSFRKIGNTEDLRKKLFQGYAEITGFNRDDDFEIRRRIYRYSIVIWLMAGLPNWGPENPERYRELEKDLESRLLEIEEKLSDL